MNTNLTRAILTYFIASVWIINGLLCKILNLVPRHEEIVARILGNTYSRQLTIAIGIAELIMAIWVLSKYMPKLNTVMQIAVVVIMNIIEYNLVPDLLLWQKANIVFALIFSLIVYYHGFKLGTK